MPSTIISDLNARIIASDWHAGQTSALYALSSTGAILPECQGELSQLRAHHRADRGLFDLAEYLRRRGVRGPQAGWSDLRW